MSNGLVALCQPKGLRCAFPQCGCEIIEDRRRPRDFGALEEGKFPTRALAEKVAQVEEDVRREMAAGCRAEDCRATEYQTLLDIFTLLNIYRSRSACR